MNMIVAIWLCFDYGAFTHSQSMELINIEGIQQYIVIDDTTPVQLMCDELYLKFGKDVLYVPSR